MHDSHARARSLFDASVDNYEQRSAARIHNFSSLVFQRRIDIVESLLESVPLNGKLLDFGMGPAVFARHCLDRGLSYVGIDISSEMVDRARSLGLEGARFAVGDVDSLVEYADQFDAVMAIGLLDYLERPGSGLAALARCVRTNGQLIVSFRNRDSVPRVLRDLTKPVARSWMNPEGNEHNRALLAPVHEHSFDFDAQLRPKLTKLGFGRFDVRYFNCSPFFFNFPLTPSLWQSWRRWDARAASHGTRLLCSGAVLSAQRLDGPARGASH
jgi:SAM-dependent methyltransferase